MKSLLYIQASPRRDRSRSITVADRFVQACRDRQKGLEVIRLNLFEADLPVFDGAALEAKYAILHGQDVRPEHKAAWAEVEAVIEAFRRADAYVFAVPMWNFGLPYRLKHYFDVLIQPGYTFTFDPDAGYSGLVTGKPAMVVYARGGAYPADTPMAAYDLQKPYVEQLLRFIGFEDIGSIIVEPTLHGSAKDKETVVNKAIEEARRLAGDWAAA